MGGGSHFRERGFTGVHEKGTSQGFTKRGVHRGVHKKGGSREPCELSRGYGPAHFCVLVCPLLQPSVCLLLSSTLCDQLQGLPRTLPGHSVSLQLYWKIPRCRCHPCRSILAWWLHAATEVDTPFLPYVVYFLIPHTAENQVIPQQLNDASIIQLYKKVNRKLCDNYRGISLIAIAGKILAQVPMLNKRLIGAYIVIN